LSFKAWIAELALEGKLPAWVYRFAGKEIASKLDLKEGTIMDTKKWYQSKTIWTAILGVVLGAIQPISTAFGHPITVPQWVLEVLAGMGLYGLRTGDQPIQ
jgi:hypothetical protein